MRMDREILLYETSSGEKPVENFIKSLEASVQAKTIHTIDLLEKYGFLLGMPHAKRLSDDIYELRIRGKQEIRIFYAFMKEKIYLLHGFKKQTNKTPKRETETALKRKRLLT